MKRLGDGEVLVVTVRRLKKSSRSYVRKQYYFKYRQQDPKFPPTVFFASKIGSWPWMNSVPSTNRQQANTTQKQTTKEESFSLSLHLSLSLSLFQSIDLLTTKINNEA